MTVGGAEVTSTFLSTSFFASLLTVISSLAGNCLDEDIIEQAANEAAGRVFRDCGGNEVSFDAFAAWYTSQGFEFLSWIELLSNTKWKLPADVNQVKERSHL